jgi:hypothetical protein
MELKGTYKKKIRIKIKVPVKIFIFTKVPLVPQDLIRQGVEEDFHLVSFVIKWLVREELNFHRPVINRALYH